MYLFLHGLIGSATHWDAIRAELPPGSSSHAPQIDYCGQPFAQVTGDLRDILRQAGGGPRVIIANSIGCVAALDLGDVADRIILTGPPFDQSSGHVPLRRSELEAFVRALFHPSLSAKVADDHVRQAIACLDRLTGSRAMLREVRRLRKLSESFAAHPGLTRHARKITCLLGQDDFMTPVNSVSAHLAHVAPQARVLVVPQCGHAVPVERPGAVLDVLRRVGTVPAMC